jgi:DGQHR domain-containing protein
MSNINDELEDFDSFEQSGKLKNELSLSNVYNVKIGGFGEMNLKTYLGTLTVEELETDVQFYETLSKDKSWPISQIIQREVDKIRVSNISRDYILGKGRVVKYFPPIIVAILPKAVDGKIDLKFDYNTDRNEAIKEQVFERSLYRSNEKMRELFAKSSNLSKINSFFILKVSEVFDLNVLCWDKSKYYAIVIDGQHRLDAIIKSKKDDIAVSKYVQDTVFLDLSLLSQFYEGKYSPVELVRRLFVDINTNAKKVGVVRQILMDDKDLAALLVQSLVDSVNKDGSDKLSGSFLRSQIVDWYGESLKHNLPHLTGILSLYQVLSDFLIQYNVSSIDDLRSPQKVTNWVKRLNDYFFVDKRIAAQEQPIQLLSDALNKFNAERDLVSNLDGIDDDVKETTLFQYDYTVLEIAQKSFENIYAKSIVRIFDDLLPYKDSIAIIEMAGGFDTQTILSEALLSSNKKIYSSQILKEKLAEIRIELEVKLYERYYLLYSVLGQKSLFNLYFKKLFKDFNSSFNDEICMGLTLKFIGQVNNMLTVFNGNHPSPFGKKDSFTVTNFENREHLLDLGTIATSFWEGIIYEDGRIIYNSQGIASLTSAIDYMLQTINAVQNNLELPNFSISFMKSRTSRIIRRRFELDKTESDSYADEIISLKRDFLIDYIKKSLLK